LHALVTTFEQPYRDLRVDDLGLETLHELYTAVRDAGETVRSSSTPTTS